MRTVLAAVALLLLTPACNSLVDPEVDVFTLATINDAALPAAHPDSPHIEITSGSLELFTDGRLRLENVIRCNANLPEGVTCDVSGDGRTSADGTYSRKEGTAQFGQSAEVPALTYVMDFEADRVRITIMKPPSGGFVQPFRFEYRR